MAITYIILPALNEEKTIGKTIEDIPLSLLGASKIIVVDNYSTDSTHDIALRHGCVVVSGITRGKGNAIKEAQAYLQDKEFNYVVMLDSDYTYPGSFIPAIVKLLNDYDIVLGSRLSGTIELGAMSTLNLLGNKILTLMARILFGVKITDLCTGMWGFRSDCFKTINITETGFGLEANLLSESVKLHYKISEIPIRYRKRPTKAKLKAIKDGIIIGSALIKLRVRNWLWLIQ